MLTKVLADANICKGLYICSIGRSVAPVGPAVVHPDPGGVVQFQGGEGVQIRGGCPERSRTTPPDLDGLWKRLVSTDRLSRGMGTGNEGGAGGAEQRWRGLT